MGPGDWGTLRQREWGAWVWGFEEHQARRLGYMEPKGWGAPGQGSEVHRARGVHTKPGDWHSQSSRIWRAQSWETRAYGARGVGVLGADPGHWGAQSRGSGFTHPGSQSALRQGMLGYTELGDRGAYSRNVKPSKLGDSDMQTQGTGVHGASRLERSYLGVLGCAELGLWSLPSQGTGVHGAGLW